LFFVFPHPLPQRARGRAYTCHRELTPLYLWERGWG
jgi:hypothetical protein